MRTQALFERYYFSRPSFVGGTQVFHQICETRFRSGGRILEIGAGPANPTSQFVSSLGPITALDMSDEVLGNPDVADAYVYDGRRMPFADELFDMCVSNYVLEHVKDPLSHFQEASRILKPGGTYCFRTPNLWHYITMSSRLLPHYAHLGIANRLRGIEGVAHDPWPTVYHANTRRQLRRLAAKTDFIVDELRMIEAEPCYGAAHPVLFYPMMAYERLVNSSELFRSIRVNILGAFRKSGRPLSIDAAT
jgi:SAM-dependent methyltransferase